MISSEALFFIFILVVSPINHHETGHMGFNNWLQTGGQAYSKKCFWWLVLHPALLLNGLIPREERPPPGADDLCLRARSERSTNRSAESWRIIAFLLRFTWSMCEISLCLYNNVMSYFQWRHHDGSPSTRQWELVGERFLNQAAQLYRWSVFKLK